MKKGHIVYLVYQSLPELIMVRLNQMQPWMKKHYLILHYLAILPLMGMVFFQSLLQKDILLALRPNHGAQIILVVNIHLRLTQVL